MCGRFTRITPIPILAQQFLFPDMAPEQPPRFNVAPTQDVAAVRAPDDVAHRQLVFLRWGLVPHWAEDPAMGNRLINARAETAAEKPAFRSAFRKHRCLILADGFYEWQAVSGKKKPFYFRMADGKPFALAGLWDHWEGEDRAIDSCTVLTTSANELVRPVHERMPVILPAADYDRWLDAAVHEPKVLQPLLCPYPADAMTAHAVSTLVNNARNDTPRCIEPAA
jgi:putative SOS response-associated peptidase YedK